MSRTSSHVIGDYVGDLLALESHFAEALAEQIRELADGQRDVAGELSRCQRTVQDHVQALRKVRRVGEPGLGGAIAVAIKRAGAVAAALEAAGTEQVRMAKPPGDLRDHYATSSLATIGYVALYTAAVSLDDGLVSLLAARHLKDYARVTRTLAQLMPGAVLDSLKAEGLPARDEFLPVIRRALHTAWDSTAAAVPQPA